MCTHIIYSFAKLQNGELAPYEWNDESTDWSKGMYERTMDLKKINPSLKVLIAVGGVNFGILTKFLIFYSRLNKYFSWIKRLEYGLDRF
jgi:hypothetical protein